MRTPKKKIHRSQGCVNVLNLHRIDLARKYHTHLQREIEKEEAREKEWKNSH
jgi:ABC-type phosphate/phosphonate transport system ATPase subunit